MRPAADGSSGGMSAAQGPRILADTSELAAHAAADDERGAVWRLTEPVRHLDANVIAVPPGGSIDAYVGAEEDVLWHVIAGEGTLSTDDGDVALTPGSIVWLPRRSQRALTAGPKGLRYLSVHRRKGGMQIGARHD